LLTAPVRIAGGTEEKMKNIEKLEIAARRAHYAPSTGSGNWDADSDEKEAAND